jgi:hypothetical protein
VGEGDHERLGGPGMLAQDRLLEGHDVHRRPVAVALVVRALFGRRAGLLLLERRFCSDALLEIEAESPSDSRFYRG